MRVSSNDFPSDGVFIKGMSVYTMRHKSAHSGRTETDSCVGDRRMLDSRFFRNVPPTPSSSGGKSPRAITKFKSGYIVDCV